MSTSTPVLIMAVEYYSTDFGTFSLVVSDDIFNNISSSNVATYPPWEDIIVTLAHAGGHNVDQSLLGIAQLKCRSVNLGPLYGLPDLTSPFANYYYDFASNPTRKIRIEARGRNADIVAYSYFEIEGVGGNYVPLKHAPYGVFGTHYTGESTANEIQFSCLLCNNDKTSFKTFGMSVHNNGSVGYHTFTMDADVNNVLKNFFSGVKPTPMPGPDPYAPGGHSGGGGGTGTFSRTGDTVGEHNTPTLSAVDAGFITLFAPTAGEMKALASYLWSDLFSIDTFKKIFANPMDAILGLSIVPVSVPTAGSASVKVGNISTGVSMTKASTQYVKLSCGSLEVEEFWGAYLDYSPYTKCQIYLPYIGIHELSIDDVMGKTIKVVYYIDILSGACTAEIYSNSTCLYSFVGQCSASIPITGNDWTNVINGVMQIGASIGAMVASGGLSAPISGAGVASGLKGVASTSSTVTSSKPSVERSGSMSGAGGMLGQQTPYLIITWPKECIPAEQNKFIGYPSFINVNLGDIVGFNVIESVHLENINATNTELAEIESLLKSGVIF